MPYGMEDASHLPRIANALREKGYSEADTRKIPGGSPPLSRDPRFCGLREPKPSGKRLQYQAPSVLFSGGTSAAGAGRAREDGIRWRFPTS